MPELSSAAAIATGPTRYSRMEYVRPRTRLRPTARTTLRLAGASSQLPFAEQEPGSECNYPRMRSRLPPGGGKMHSDPGFCRNLLWMAPQKKAEMIASTDDDCAPTVRPAGTAPSGPGSHIRAKIRPASLVRQMMSTDTSVLETWFVRKARNPRPGPRRSHLRPRSLAGLGLPCAADPLQVHVLEVVLGFRLHLGIGHQRVHGDLAEHFEAVADAVGTLVLRGQGRLLPAGLGQERLEDPRGPDRDFLLPGRVDARYGGGFRMRGDHQEHPLRQRDLVGIAGFRDQAAGQVVRIQARAGGKRTGQGRGDTCGGKHAHDLRHSPTPQAG